MTLLKREFSIGAFLWTLQSFKEHLVYRTLPVAASEDFANSCDKIVSPILLQELINDFAVCKHWSGTLLRFEDTTRVTVLETRTELYISKRSHTF